VPAVITHRVRLDRRDVSEYRGVPVTTVPRTLVEMAGRFDLDSLAAVCHEAQIRFRVRAPQVEAALQRYPNAKGAANLMRIFRGEAHILLSPLERNFLALLRAAKFPLPQTNRRAGGRYVDCRWPEHRLTVELDSYTYHHTRHAWQQDHQREREARARGDEFRRYTRDDLKDDPRGVVSELRLLLNPATTASAGARAARRPPRGARAR
jgi:very-short-patch-repair endonuclease